MKKFFIIAIIFISSASFAQVDISLINSGDNQGQYFKDIQNNFTPFLGTWTSTVGDITYRVTLYKEEMVPIGTPVQYHMDFIRGKFEIIKFLGLPNEEIICESRRFYSSSNYMRESVISATANGIILKGIINDNCVSPSSLEEYPGNLTMSIINPSSTPMQAVWEVKVKGLYPSGLQFSIPGPLTFTKQN